jgi:hypothetical protein
VTMMSLSMVLVGARLSHSSAPVACGDADFGETRDRQPKLRIECARPIDFAMLGGNPGREVTVKCSEGVATATAFVWADRGGMILSSATLRR